MIIKNGRIFRAEGCFKTGDIVIEEDKIANVCLYDQSEEAETAADDAIIDASGMYVIPGLIDIHTHGCMGFDMCDGTMEAIETIARYQLQQGVTGMCPTSMSYGEEKLVQAFKNVADYADAVRYHREGTEQASTILGINMEGPFLSAQKNGAQNNKYLCDPNIDMFYKLQGAARGMIEICDIAPELPGAWEFIEMLSDEVHISLAHTQADYTTALSAYVAGADHVTHLYNAMTPLGHREPGVIGATVDTEGIYVELIGDGVHVHPSAVRSAFKLMGDDRIVLISDSMRACGLPNGEYDLGGQVVTVRGRTCSLSDGTIAGSTANLMDVLRCVAGEMDISLEQAVKAATVNPAKSIGCYSRYGSLDAMKYADIVLLDANLKINSIIKNGIVVK